MIHCWCIYLYIDGALNIFFYPIGLKTIFFFVGVVLLGIRILVGDQKQFFFSIKNLSLIIVMNM